MDQPTFYATSDIYFQTLKKADEAYFSEYFALIKRYIPIGASFLDVGCGTGQSSALLTQRGYRVTGCDITPRFIEEARQTYPAVPFEVADASRLPFKNNSFEAVGIYNTLEHVTDVPAVLAEMLRVTKNGGLVIIHSPNLLSIKHIIDAARRRKGMTFEGRKNMLQLAGLGVRNIAWILGRIIAHRPKFTYRTPSEIYDFPDNDATVYLNPVDIKLQLEKLGARVVSYQEVRHLERRGLAKDVGSNFFADHMSIIRIVARKGARYERH